MVFPLHFILVECSAFYFIEDTGLEPHCIVLRKLEGSVQWNSFPLYGVGYRRAAAGHRVCALQLQSQWEARLGAGRNTRLQMMPR